MTELGSGATGTRLALPLFTFTRWSGAPAPHSEDHQTKRSQAMAPPQKKSRHALLISSEIFARGWASREARHTAGAGCDRFSSQPSQCLRANELNVRVLTYKRAPRRPLFRSAPRRPPSTSHPFGCVAAPRAAFTTSQFHGLASMFANALGPRRPHSCARYKLAGATDLPWES